MSELKVVVTAAEADFEHRLEILQSASLVEVRLDLVSGEFLKNNLRQAIEKTGRPVILTYRLPQDSSIKTSVAHTTTDLQSLLSGLESPENFLDIELNRENSLFADFTQSSFSRIHSFHNFHSIISLEEMKSEIAKIPNPGKFDIFKFAVMPQNLRQVGEFMQNIKTLSHSHRICGICMGEFGTISRVFGDHYGSLLTYCSAAEEMAPGQVSVPVFYSLRPELS